MIAHGDDTYRYKDIRLNFSSNIYNHFDHAHLFRHLAEQMPCITSYPEPTPESLEQRLAASLHVQPDNVLVSNGATEAIYLIAQAFQHLTPDIPRPTFSEYQQASSLFSSSAFNPTHAIHWLCNPNNPTGTVIPKTQLLRSIVPDDMYVIDQSYAPYYEGELLSADDVTSRGNIILIHSMTKEFGIPGLRLGYVIADAAIIHRLRELRMPWSVNALAIKAGHYLLDHKEDYVIPVAMLNHERQRVAQALVATNAIYPLPSDTHILLCRLHKGTATQLKELLATNHGILIRDASNFTGLDHRYFRIAVQHPNENNILIDSITAAMKQL